jgi:ferritin-like metal-binding protein YciE
MAIQNLDEKFVHDLGDIYDAEHRFLEAQQEMLQHAHAQAVQMLLTEHIAQTQQQIDNIGQIYKQLGVPPQRVRCDAAAGLVTEGQKGLKETAGAPAIQDTMIAGACAKVEHYEIASYRGLIEGAKLMNNSQVLALLQQNLQQEEQTAMKIEQNTPVLLNQALAANQMGR